MSATIRSRRTRSGGTASSKRRCLVPASSFCEPNGDVKPATWHWFAINGADARPLFAFPGIWRRYRGPVKKDGPNVDIETYAFLTTTPNPLVATINHERMPVLLTREEEFETWLRGSPDEAFALAREYPAEQMRIVQEGFDKEDLAEGCLMSSRSGQPHVSAFSQGRGDTRRDIRGGWYGSSGARNPPTAASAVARGSYRGRRLRRDFPADSGRAVCSSGTRRGRWVRIAGERLARHRFRDSMLANRAADSARTQVARERAPSVVPFHPSLQLDLPRVYQRD